MAPSMSLIGLTKISGNNSDWFVTNPLFWAKQSLVEYFLLQIWAFVTDQLELCPKLSNYISQSRLMRALPTIEQLYKSILPVTYLVKSDKKRPSQNPNYELRAPKTILLAIVYIGGLIHQKTSATSIF